MVKRAPTGGSFSCPCPHCGNLESSTKNSRRSESAPDQWMRRRICLKCAGRFTTLEVNEEYLAQLRYAASSVNLRRLRKFAEEIIEAFPQDAPA